MIGGDFNAQLSHLNTNSSGVNRWNFLTSLVQEKKEAADTFRTVHRERLAFTRYKRFLLPCDTRIDLLLFSLSVVSLPSASLVEADIESADTSSAHNPIFCTFRLPCTAQYPPLLHPLHDSAGSRRRNRSSFTRVYNHSRCGLSGTAQPPSRRKTSSIMSPLLWNKWPRPTTVLRAPLQSTLRPKLRAILSGRRRTFLKTPKRTSSN